MKQKRVHPRVRYAKLCITRLMQSGRLCKVNARKAGNDCIAARFTLHSYSQDNQDKRLILVFQGGKIDHAAGRSAFVGAFAFSPDRYVKNISHPSWEIMQRNSTGNGLESMVLSHFFA